MSAGSFTKNPGRKNAENFRNQYMLDKKVPKLLRMDKRTVFIRENDYGRMLKAIEKLRCAKPFIHKPTERINYMDPRGRLFGEQKYGRGVICNVNNATHEI